MTVTIVATVGGATSNSFVTEAEASTYLASRLNATAYTAETDADKQRASLVEATRELCTRTWQGQRASSSQALAWPREWCPNPDDPSADYFATTVIPQRIKDATCELALEFLRAGTTDLASADPNAGVIQKTIDVISTTWEGTQRATGWSRFPRVLGLIGPLMSGDGSSVPVMRG